MSKLWDKRIMNAVENMDGEDSVPEYVALCAYRINQQRNGFYEAGRRSPDCELSIINNVCLPRGITPTQAVYDEVYRAINQGYSYVR